MYNIYIIFNIYIYIIYIYIYYQGGPDSFLAISIRFFI